MEAVWKVNDGVFVEICLSTADPRRLSVLCGVGASVCFGGLSADLWRQLVLDLLVAPHVPHLSHTCALIYLHAFFPIGTQVTL